MVTTLKIAIAIVAMRFIGMIVTGCPIQFDPAMRIWTVHVTSTAITVMAVTVGIR
jgi:NO-binding membrane sensor protein with MHYT domain